MLGEAENFRNNIKDNSFITTPSTVGKFNILSYSKTNKLITAMYMVTDILNENEPIRHKLRTLGIEIVSDISMLSGYGISHTGTSLRDISVRLNTKAHEVISFLEIAFSLGMISEMNFNILRKEFIELKSSIEGVRKEPDILDLLKEDPSNNKNIFERVGPFKGQPIGHTPTRIGVQKGGTLLKALSDRMSDKNVLNNFNHNKHKLNNTLSFNVLKDKRREEILSIIKDMKKDNLNFSGASIKDIVLAFKKLGEEIGEKTIQRELVAMVSGGLLNKSGEKRWSRYSLS